MPIKLHIPDPPRGRSSVSLMTHSHVENEAYVADFRVYWTESGSTGSNVVKSSRLRSQYTQVL
jgi:hypothetical protein